MSHTVDWKKCKECGYWLKSIRHKMFKCYAGYCPARLRDNRNEGQ